MTLIFSFQLSPRFTPHIPKVYEGGETIGKRFTPGGETGVNLLVTVQYYTLLDSPPLVNLLQKKIHPPP